MDDLNVPATKGDIEQLRSEMQHQFDELKETLRDSQTEVLQAFYGYTQATAPLRSRLGSEPRA